MPPARAISDTAISALAVHLFGEPVVMLSNGQRLALARKDAALLALLALDGPQGRDRVAGLLWPEATLSMALASLRQRLHRLRKGGADRLVEITDRVRLGPGITTDLDHEPDPSHQGERVDRLLGHFEYDNEVELAAWVDSARALTRSRRIDLLMGQAARHESRAEISSAITLVERALVLEPLREHAWRNLMRLHYLRGDRASAIAAFERFESRLRDELGARPDVETIALLALMEQDGPVARTLSRPLSPVLSRPPRLIGRQDEWQAMHQAWAQGQAIVLMGVAGVGKSRLLRDFVGERAGALVTAARSGDSQTPYAVLSNLLVEVLERYPVDLRAHERDELSRLLPALGQPPASAGSQGLLWRSIETLLARAEAGGLTVLAVDDLQFADLATIEHLRWLVASPALAGVRFAFACRPLGDGPIKLSVADWLAASGRPVAISLRAWSLAEVTELVRSLGDHVPADSLVAASPAGLFAHAGGHPYFTLETIKDLVAHRGPEKITALPLPSSVQALIERRMGELSTPARHLLQIAAVFGRAPPPRLATRLLALSPIDVSDAYAELAAAEVLRGELFAHDLMREAALGLVPQAVAKSLHAEVAQALEAEPRASAAHVAEHWMAADRWSEAAQALHQAGLAARRAGRLTEQHDLLTQAAHCWRKAESPAGEFDALHDAIDSVLIRFGGQAMLDQIPLLERCASSAEQRLRAQMSHADALLNLSRFEEALVVSTSMVNQARNHPHLLVDALCLHGQALVHNGHADAAIDNLTEGRALAIAQPNDASALHVYSALAFVLTAAGRTAEAINAQREALDRAIAARDAAETALAHGNLATALSAACLPIESHRHAKVAVDMHGDMTSTLGVHAAIAQLNLAASAAWLGMFDQAALALDGARLALQPELGPAARAKFLITAANLAMATADYDEAMRHFAEVPDDAPPVMQLQAATGLAGLLRRGNLGDEGPRARIEGLLAEHPGLLNQPAALLALAIDVSVPDLLVPLQRAADEAAQRGLPGVERSLQLRRLGLMVAHRDAGSGALAVRLAGELGAGFSAGIEPAMAWCLVAQALRDAGQAAHAQQCQTYARQWIDSALATMTESQRARHLALHPLHLRLSLTSSQQ